MRLVDDDVAEIEDDVRPAADLPTLLRRRVAVVDRRAHVGRVQLPQRTRLILRKRLGGVEVERPALRLARERVEHGKVEGKRLARRGAGGEDQVLAALGRVPGLALVRVQRIERQRLAQSQVELVGKRRRSRVRRRNGREVRKLLTLEQIVPERSAEGHFAMVAWAYRGALRG